MKINFKLSKGTWIIILSVLLILIDQVSKILVKTSMLYGQSFNVLGDWFQICFVENNGMAFGMQFGGDVGKLILTLLRIVLVVFLIIYLKRLLKKDTPNGILIGITLIMVGAVGNIIDCMFYGILFGPSTPYEVATFLPEGGGYAPFFFGKVVDMFYFPIIDTTLPNWLPIWGGRHFSFFNAIFNVADACITCGALYLIIFKWKFFSREVEGEKKESE